jgi:hypothetical protein
VRDVDAVTLETPVIEEDFSLEIEELEDRIAPSFAWADGT